MFNRNCRGRSDLPPKCSARLLMQWRRGFMASAFLFLAAPMGPDGFLPSTVACQPPVPAKIIRSIGRCLFIAPGEMAMGDIIDFVAWRAAHDTDANCLAITPPMQPTDRADEMLVAIYWALQSHM